MLYSICDEPGGCVCVCACMRVVCVCASTCAGQYLYIETSLPRSNGDKAIVTSPQYRRPITNFCQMTFWYHMYGSTIGTLNVHVYYNSLDRVFWTRKGNQNNTWHSATISLPRSTVTTAFTVCSGLFDELDGARLNINYVSRCWGMPTYADASAHASMWAYGRACIPTGSILICC